MGNTISKISYSGWLYIVFAVGALHANDVTPQNQRSLLVEDIEFTPAENDEFERMFPEILYCIQRKALFPKGHLKHSHITAHMLHECGIEKIYAFTDVHGAYKPMLNMLQHHNIIQLDREITTDSIHPPTEIEITVQNAIIIFGGDALDRGSQSFETLYFLRHLHQHINVWRTVRNSLFIYLQGNHEEFYLTLGLQGAYGDIAWRAWLPSTRPFTEHEFQKHGIPELYTLTDYFGQRMEIGHFLRDTLVIGVIVGDTLYSHAGFTPTFWSQFSAGREDKNNLELLHELNNAWWEALVSGRKPYQADSTWLEHGPTMQREYSFRNSAKAAENPMICEKVAQFLRQFGYAQKMFIGHNHDAVQVSTWCQGKLIKADVDLYFTEMLYLPDSERETLARIVSSSDVDQRKYPESQMFVYDVKASQDNTQRSHTATDGRRARIKEILTEIYSRNPDELAYHGHSGV